MLSAALYGLVMLVLSSGHIPGWQYVQSKGVPFMIAVGKTIKPKKYITNFSVVEHTVTSRGLFSVVL